MQRAIVIGLALLGMTVGCAFTLMLRQRWNALRWLAVSLVLFLLEYVVISAILFLPDVFSVARTLAAQAALNILLTACWLGYRLRKHRGRHNQPIFGTVDWDFREYRIPLVLVIIALLIGCNTYGFFGMGQDEGVYQTKAIDFMNGKNSTVYHFDELDSMEDVEKENTTEYTRGVLIGLYQRDDENYSASILNRLPSFLNAYAVKYQNGTDAVYHGIPTYPALLALFGILGGDYAHMMDVQPLMYALTLLILWFTVENFGLKKSSAVFVCAGYLLSPQIIWLSKSALTELLLGMIMAMFMYLISEPENTRHRWWSAFMVTAFSVVHVSIYVFFPMFVALYCILYLYSGERQYLLGCAWASASFMAGFTFMTIIGPYYTIINTGPILVGGINYGNVWYVLMAMGLAGLLVSFCLPGCRCHKSFRNALKTRGMNIAFRAVILLPLVMACITFISSLRIGTIRNALNTNGFYVMIWLTGIVAIPAAIISLMRRGCRFLRSSAHVAISVLFIYSVLFMACFLKRSIEYCYYYSRYLGPYIPVACLMAGAVLDRLSAIKVYALLAVSALTMLPFDSALLTQGDDTNCSFDTLNRVLESVSQEKTAVLFPRSGLENYRLFCLPIRSGGSECYLLEQGADAEAQLARLTARYDTVYAIGNEGLPAVFEGGEILRIQEKTSMDDNVSFRLPFSPLPTAFKTQTRKVAIHKWSIVRCFHSAQLFSTGSSEEGRILLETGQIQFGPYIHLNAGTYRICVEGQGLAGAAIYATADNGTVQLPIGEVAAEADCAVYTLTLSEPMDNVEFLVRNDGSEKIYVDRITIEDLTYRSVNSDTSVSS